LTQTAISNQLAVGDIVFFAAATAARSVVLGKEARKVVAINSNTEIVVERGVLGTTLLENVAGDVAFKLSVGGAFPGGQGVPAVGPQKSLRDPSGIHSGDNQVQGNIQTTGVRMPRGGPVTGAITAGNAKGISTHSLLDTANNNYGFDSDFRLYSVLGPFMRPAIIRDVIDTSKISRSVQTSRFPGVTTIHDAAPVSITTNNVFLTNVILDTPAAPQGIVLATKTNALTVLEVGDLLMTAATTKGVPECIARGEVMEVLSIDKNAAGGQITVRRGALGSLVQPVALDDVVCRLITPPREERNNNGLYSLAPIVGTTFAKAQDRKTQEDK